MALPFVINKNSIYYAINKIPTQPTLGHPPYNYSCSESDKSTHESHLVVTNFSFKFGIKGPSFN